MSAMWIYHIVQEADGHKVLDPFDSVDDELLSLVARLQATNVKAPAGGRNVEWTTSITLVPPVQPSR